MKKNKLDKNRWEMKNIFQRIFLLFSIVLSIILINNCNDQSNPVIIENNFIAPGNIKFGGSAISVLFQSAAKGAASGFGSAAAGWALGALGLSDQSPDYSEELGKINQNLQEIIAQLNSVQDQLSDINNQLLILDCNAQQTALTTQTGRIDFLATLYKSYIATAESGGRVSNNTLSNWVDQVLAEGIYSGQTPMGQILSTIANQLIQPSSGAIIACVRAVQKPGNDTFSDESYYNKVDQFTNYYYYYQAQGLYLLNEACHYKAWLTANDEEEADYPADSVSNVCRNADAILYCTKAGTFTNTVYNALIRQFTVAGAPYTDEHFLVQNHETSPRLWVKSLEEFTIAAGDNCNTPLNSVNNRCGVTVGRYNSGNGAINNVVYRDYSNWQFANAFELNTLLGGWSSGTAGYYLQSNLGFSNMDNKIFLSSNTITISLSNSGATQSVVIFIDGNTNKNLISNKLFDNSNAFNVTAPTSKTTGSGSCAPLPTTFYYYYGNSAGTSSSWYFRTYGIAQWCGNNVLFGGVQWYGGRDPAWLSTNTSDDSRQFRLLFGPIQSIACTENRSNKNAGEVWTMCGDNFTYWLTEIVPRPETCDEPVGVGCILDAENISRAKHKFQNL